MRTEKTPSKVQNDKTKKKGSATFPKACPLSSSAGISEAKSLHRNHPGSDRVPPARSCQRRSREGPRPDSDRTSRHLGPSPRTLPPHRPLLPRPRPVKHPNKPLSSSLGCVKAGFLSNLLFSGHLLPGRGELGRQEAPAPVPSGRPAGGGRQRPGRGRPKHNKRQIPSPGRLISARKSPARYGGRDKRLHLHFSPLVSTCAAPREPGGGPGGGGRRGGVPPARLSPNRGWRLPSGGGREGGAGAARALCAVSAPRSLSLAQGRHIAPPWPCRRGGSGTAACIGAITVSARPRWRPEDARRVRESGAGAARPGVPGEAAPSMRGGATSAPPAG